MDALFNIGTLYESGLEHPRRQPDLYSAHRYYAEAAEKGHCRAQVKLADMLLKGVGCAEGDDGDGNGDGLGDGNRHEQARRWLELAAEQNHAEAMNRLGQLYEIGVGMANGGGPSVDESKRWYAKALALGNENAMSNMGALYELGIGVDRDLDKAMKLYMEVG